MINPDQPFFVPEVSKDEEGPFREHRNVSAGPSNSKTKVIHFHLQSRGDVGKICLAVIGRTEESFGEEARMVIGLSLCQGAMARAGLAVRRPRSVMHAKTTTTSVP